MIGCRKVLDIRKRHHRCSYQLIMQSSRNINNHNAFNRKSFVTIEDFAILSRHDHQKASDKRHSSYLDEEQNAFPGCVTFCEAAEHLCDRNFRHKTPRQQTSDSKKEQKHTSYHPQTFRSQNLGRSQRQCVLYERLEKEQQSEHAQNSS